MKKYNAPDFIFMEYTASDDLLTVSVATAGEYGNFTMWSDFVGEIE